MSWCYRAQAPTQPSNKPGVSTTFGYHLGPKAFLKPHWSRARQEGTGQGARLGSAQKPAVCVFPGGRELVACQACVMCSPAPGQEMATSPGEKHLGLPERMAHGDLGTGARNPRAPLQSPPQRQDYMSLCQLHTATESGCFSK